ncbi:5,6-dimethylbenzimidazole synthase [Swingsia samuiensis]|uniref:5,6-dimethylbenzimidazole synthase n=1 Tax=Swingsia samuiensis TaxID=1293412 RepID=A0A4Y6UJJ6_9PROT|nr:5,6-dimethylbenzimidazole synthase [Swingsia samuiensis]QDH17742.1 5,6-dimethylbenzimidazole synthase [Swingsia samuiensis]
MQQPDFSHHFSKELNELFKWRRDVRHFQRQPLPDHLLDDLLQTSILAPSVGLSEPWRFMLVESPKKRSIIRQSFETCNKNALEGYDGEQASNYASLKLAGLDDAPHHVAVFCEKNTKQGQGLGRQTMPATTTWSTVMAIHTFWLAATAAGVGIGWVSILEPNLVAKALEAEDNWEFIAYLCVGYPVAPSSSPELERMGWEKRNPERRQWIRR